MTETVIYLDNAATTALDPDVLEVMLPFLRESYGNPSSVHRLGRVAKVAVEDARGYVAALFDADPSEILFVSGGTEADNTAIAAALRLGRAQGRDRIVTSQAEHQAVLKACAARVADEEKTVHVRVNPAAVVETDSVRTALGDDVALCSFMHANNETGAVNPIAELARAAKDAGALFHTDAVQSAGKLPLSSREIPFDFAAASAHKMHGPKGIGALYVRSGLVLPPLIAGGAQERGRRGGTESVPAIVGFGEAARRALAQRDARLEAWREMRRVLVDLLHRTFPGIVINGGQQDALPTIVSASFPASMYPLHGETLVMNLDLERVAVSSGSACTAGSVEPSHVMRAIGHDAATAAATLRFSFGKDSTIAEAEEAVRRLEGIVWRMLPRATPG